MHKYEKSRQKERKNDEKLTPTETQVSKNMRWRQQCETKQGGETKMQISECCTGKSGNNSQPSLIGWQSCKWHNLAFLNTLTKESGCRSKNWCPEISVKSNKQIKSCLEKQTNTLTNKHKQTNTQTHTNKQTNKRKKSTLGDKLGDIIRCRAQHDNNAPTVAHFHRNLDNIKTLPFSL